MIKHNSFSEALRASYSKEALFKLFKVYFLDWIAEGYIGSSLGLFEISLITENSNQQTFIDLMEQMYSPKNFHTIYNSLSDDIKITFHNIAWNGKHYIKDNKSLYLKDDSSYNLAKDLKDEFLFFRAEKDLKKEEYLTLNYALISRLRKLLPEKPQDYYLYPIKDNATPFTCNDETVFMENVRLYYDFYSQGGLALSSSGKILKESKLAMKKYCNISEYYNDDYKDLQHLKTETIGLFFHLINEDLLKTETFKASNLKDLVLSFLTGKIIKDDKFHYTFLYLNYLKGLKNIDNSDERICRALETISKIILEFPVTEISNPTISINNIIKRIVLQDEFIEIIELQIAQNNIYINEANYERTKIASYDQYLNYIIAPFVKSVFFILGTLGIFELMYEAPTTNNCLYLKNGHLSKYDGLKYVQLTEFGKFVFNFTDSYHFNSVKEEGHVHLDDERLFITILGEAPSKAMFFESISQKISNNNFKITSETFLKDIVNSDDLKARIILFKDRLDTELPPIWSSFLTNLENKSSLIKVVNEYIVLKLENSPELLSTIGKDERFKQIVLKGEDFHIIVKEENYPKLKSLFKEYGYSINCYLES